MLLFSSFFATFLVAKTFGASSEKPNVILILADDLGFNDMPWNNPAIIAPNLHSLAKNGTILSNFYVQPVCTPSRSALMTSRYPIRLGLQTSVITAPQPSCLPLDEVTIGDEMRAAGYHTHIVGKWHLGHYCPQCLPNNRGFDTFRGYLTGAEDYYKKTFCIPLVPNQRPAACGFDFYDNEDRMPKANGTYSTYQFADASREVIKSHDGSKTPFFLYLPFQSVHYPVMVPKNYSDLYPNEKNHTRKEYMGMVTAMDEAVGHIVDELKAAGAFENTLFFYATDNGGLVGAGGRNAPFRGQKATLWQGGLRVPAFISGAGVPAARNYKNMMHIVDVQMTLLDAIGHKRTGEKHVDGVSHWAAITAGDSSEEKEKMELLRRKRERTYDAVESRIQKKLAVEKPRTEILLNIDREYDRGYSPDPINFTHYENPFFDTSIHAAIVSELDGVTWKLLTGDPGCELYDFPCHKDHKLPDPFPSVWLFNLDKDPYEKNNVFGDNKDTVWTLLEKLAQYDTNSVPSFYPPRDPAADPAAHDGWWGPWKAGPNNWPR